MIVKVTSINIFNIHLVNFFYLVPNVEPKQQQAQLINFSMDKKLKNFHCHRLILSAYSEFFHYYFTTIHNSSTLIHQSSIYLDIDSETMNNILNLIYFNSVDIETELELNNLQMAARKLGLKNITIINGNNDKMTRTEISIKNHLIDFNESSTKGKKRLFTQTDDSNLFTSGNQAKCKF